MINLFSPLKSQTAVVFFQIEYCGDTFVLYSSLQCRRFIWASQPLRHLRSFIQPATFDLELESTVGGGGGERLKEYSLPHPLPSLSTPRYKFRSLSSLPLLKKSKMAAIISSRQLSTRPPKLRLLCKLSVLELYIKTKASVPGYNIGKQIIDDRSELATSLVTNHVRLVFKYSWRFKAVQHF